MESPNHLTGSSDAMRAGPLVSSAYHAIGPKRKMPGVWGQSPQEPPKWARTHELKIISRGIQNSLDS